MIDTDGGQNNGLQGTNPGEAFAEMASVNAESIADKPVRLSHSEAAYAANKEDGFKSK